MNTSMIATCVIVSAIAVFGLVVPGVQALLYHVEGRFIEKTVVEQANHERTNHETEQWQRIEGPAHWISQDKGIVSVPIGQAMQMYVEKEQPKQP